MDDLGEAKLDDAGTRFDIESNIDTNCVKEETTKVKFSQR